LFAEDTVDKQEKDENQAKLVVLSEYSKDGKKKWNLTSESAEIYSMKKIKLTNPTGSLYEYDKLSMELKADEGFYERDKKNISLKDNVVIEQKDGKGSIRTDSLDWNSETATLSTEDSIKLEKDNVILVGDKMQVKKDEQTAELKENVKLKVFGEDESKHPTILTSQGKMVVNYNENIIEFYDKVIVTDPRAILKADYVKIYINKEKQNLEKVFCSGNVEIEQEDKRAVSNEAVYDGINKTIVLTGEPRIMRGENLLGADKITFYIEDERVVCEPKARLIIYPSERDKQAFNL